MSDVVSTIADISDGSPWGASGPIFLTSDFIYGNLTNVKAAQTFIVIDGTWDVSSVDLYIGRENSGVSPDAEDLTLSIRKDDPSGFTYGTSEISRLSVDTGAPTWVTFDFSGVMLSSGTTYCLVLECPAGHLRFFTWDYITWIRRNTSFYGDGNGYVGSDQDGWVSQSTTDYGAIVKGTPISSSWTDFPRPAGYADTTANQVWQPGTGWVDVNTFEYTGGGSFKTRVLAIGHKVLYFGDL